jgi:outer membrane biosynthesis protein TonB
MRVIALLTIVVTFAAAHAASAQTQTKQPTPPATPPTQTKTPAATPPAQQKTPPPPKTATPTPVPVPPPTNIRPVTPPTNTTPVQPAQTKPATQTTPPAPVAAPGAGKAKTPVPAAPVAPAAPAVAQPPAAENYTYVPDGRRDPFLSLVGTGAEPRGIVSRKGDGPAGMTLGEISVRGIVQSRGALVAMVQGPDNKTYIVHPGDKLLDGTIKTITPQGLIVIQEVNDPLSLVKQREVRKLLRSLEDAKE